MTRRTVGLDDVVRDLKTHLEVVRSAMTQGYTQGMSEQQEAALAWLETFAAISLRVMAVTNPSKIREAARLEEIKARMQGRQVLE